MAKNYQVGLIITGNAKGGVSAVKATKDELEKLNTKQKGFQKEAKTSRTSIGDMTKDFGLLKGVIAGVSFGVLARDVYDSIDAFQGYRGQLKTITGDFASASVELDRLIAISKETPFTLAQSVEGFTKLTHLGLDPSREAMISYGNTAAAMNKDLIQMIEAVADASTGEFERLKEFGIKASVEGENVRLTFQNTSTTISKDAASIQQYLLDIGNNKFGSAMADQMERVSAQSNNLTTSIDQLYDGLGAAGVTDAYSASIAGIASSIDGLTAVLPEAIGLLSSLSNIAMVGGGLYLGLQAMPYLMAAAATASRALSLNILATSMAYKAGVTPLALFTSSLSASTAATMSAVAATGLLKSAMLGLFAAYAGWEIGSYLNDQFVEVRVAGLAFVGAMETGLVNLSYAFSAIAPKAKQIWGELTTWLQNKLGALYGLIGSGLSSIGADEMALGYQNFAKSLSGASDVTKQATEELAKLDEQRKAEIETVDSIIVGLINHEYAQTASTDAINKNTEAKKKNNEVVPVVSTELTADEKYIASLKEKLRLGTLTEAQKQAEINLSKLSIAATDEQRAEVEKYTAALLSQQKITDQQSADSDYYKSIIDGANEIGESWNSAGNVIVNTFGTIGEQLDKLAKQQESYASKQKKLAADKELYKDDPAKLAEIAKAENALAQQKERNATSEISSYRAITDSAANMFSEDSKGREAMQAASNVFTALELANSAARLGSYAVEAIAAAYAAPWPIGFASGAAMVAIMAGLGVAVSSSGTAPVSAEVRQETQGTGTVLGSDDKSASINNSLERQEELQLDQYAELREMNTSLNDLNNNITYLASSFVSSFGKFDASSYGGELGEKSTTSKIESLLLGGTLTSLDPTGVLGKIIGGFSSTKKTLIDSGISIVSQTMGEIIDSGVVDAQQYFDIKTRKETGWGLSSKTTYNTEYEEIDQQLQHEMALIFGNIGSSINSAVDVLGINLTNNLDNFVIDLPNISFKDLSGDEIQAELEAIFSSQSDLMATYLVPNLQEFQKVGEGLYETLIRLAQEQAVFNSVLEITGNTLNSIDANQTIEATQAIIDFAGGIENLQSAASDFFNGFYSESEQFEYNQKQLIAQFAALDQELPATADGFKKLVQGLDPLNKEEQKLYAQLLLLSGQTAEYYETLEDLKAAQSEAISSLKTDISTLLDDLLGPTNDIQTLIDAEESRWQDQQDAAEKLYETEMSRYESALDAEKTLDEYINGLAFSENSTLSEQDQFRLARDNFASSTNQAANGDYSAVADATSDASQYLEIGKELFGTSSNMYKSMFADVNKTLTDLQSVYADFEAPEEQVIEESAELISLREQLAVQEAAAQQAENQALADLLASQLTELSALSGDSIDALIESFSIDLSELGELLSVNLTELIDVTKNGTLNSEAITNASNVIDSSNNVIAFPEINTPIAVNQAATIATSESQASTASNTEMLAELKLLREEVAALRADANDNADDAAAQRESQISTAETQTAEIVRGNLRQVAVSL